MTHKASGAVGEGTRSPDSRLNEEMALLNLIETTAFKDWPTAECRRILSKNIKIDNLPMREEIMERIKLLIGIGEGEFRTTLH